MRDPPSDPVAIESAVIQRIHYSYDWEVYGMPWYFPTVEEVLERGKGDCKARALVLAYLLEAKNIPYRVDCSPTHVWAEYEGKEETPLENPSVKFYQQDPETGERLLQPPRIASREMVDSSGQGFWFPMPEVRKALLLFGSVMLITMRLV